MKKTRNKLVDSDDDMDDLPLKYVSSIQKYSCIEELKAYSIHACEFCEKIFNNRYDYLIHNSKHIIIPLLKMLPHYCAECQRFFISDEDMNEHKAGEHKNNVIQKHHDNVVTEANTSQEILVETAKNIEDVHEDDKPLSSLCMKEKENSDVKNNTQKENILENFVMECKVDIARIESVHNIDDDIPLSSLRMKEKENAIVKNNTQKDNILQNFVMNCKVDLEKIETPWLLQSNVGEVHTHNNPYRGVNNPLEITNHTVNNAANDKEDNIITPIAKNVTSATQNKVIDKDKVEYNNHVAKFKRLAQEFKTRNYVGEFENFLVKVNAPVQRNVITVLEDIENHEVPIESPINNNNADNGHVDNCQVIEDNDVLSDAPQIHDEEEVDEEYDYEDPIIILPPFKKDAITNYASVHFDELMKPGIFQCKRCFINYHTRYDVLVHEAVHLDMSKAYLKWTKTKLKNLEHGPISTSVQTLEHKPDPKYQDNIINERLKSKNDPESYCDVCAKSFNGSTLLKAHRANCTGEAMVTLCNLCLYLRARPKNLQFYSISRLDKNDEKRQCHWCGQVTAEMSLVKTKLVIVKTKMKKKVKKLADRIAFENSPEKDKRSKEKSGFSKIKKCGGGPNKQTISKHKPGHIGKPLSNRERLKLIQTRLKLMKK